MHSSTFDLLNEEIRGRDWKAGQEAINRLASVYEGQLPAEFDKYFPQETPKHVVNLVRLAWDDLATSIGRLPEMRGEPLNQSNAEQKRVSKQEYVASSYLFHSEPNGKILMWQLAWWLLASRAVLLVVPDKVNKRPKITIRDPRTCYPGVKGMAAGQITELSDIMFKYELPAATMERMGLKAGTHQDQWGNTVQNEKGTVIEYIDDQNWIVASDGGTVIREEHGLGMVPGWVFQTFAPNKQSGIGQFDDQITFMVAISQLISMKLAHAERLVYPVTWVRGHEGTVKIGPHVLNKLGPTGDMGQLTPPTTMQVDRDISILESFSRVLNRNPEVRQGEVDSKGAYVSAKTLEQLSEAIDTVVGRHWDIISVGLQKIIEACFRMDQKMWGSVEKDLRLNVKGKNIVDTYVPNDDINGRWHINVDYGFGIGGYQGFLQNVQAMDAKLLPKKRVIEEMPGVTDVDATLRAIELESMDEAGQAMFQQLAATGQLDMALWAKFRKEMAEKGTPLHEIIIKYEEELREQAQQAMEQGGAEAMTTPAPPAPEEAPAGPGAPPPIPPELLGV
jgi:hypothetical protein